MAEANVVETPEAQAQRDTIIAEYEDILSEVRALQERAQFWRGFVDHQFAREYFDKMEMEANEKAIGWRTEPIVPKDFVVQQPRVLAIDEVVTDLKNKANDAEAELRSARQRKASWESDNLMFLQAAGYQIDQGVVESRRPARVNDGDPEFVVAEFVTMPKAKYKALLKAGFEPVANGQEPAMTFRAPYNDESLGALSAFEESELVEVVYQ